MHQLLGDSTVADAHAALAMSRLEVTLDGMTLKILVRLVVALYMTRAHGARR